MPRLYKVEWKIKGHVDVGVIYEYQKIYSNFFECYKYINSTKVAEDLRKEVQEAAFKLGIGHLFSCKVVEA